MELYFKSLALEQSGVGGYILVEHWQGSQFLSIAPRRAFSKLSWFKGRVTLLSAMIFSLLVESLTQLFLMAQSQGLLHGCSVKVGGVVIPVMQYADNTIVLIDDDLDMADNLRGLFFWFEVEWATD